MTDELCTCRRHGLWSYGLAEIRCPLCDAVLCRSCLVKCHKCPPHGGAEQILRERVDRVREPA